MWSKKFIKCQGCGTSEVPHNGRGFCVNCYHKHFVRKTGDFDRNDPQFYENFLDGIKEKISKTNKQRSTAKIKINEILTKELLYELYYKKKKSLEDIGQLYGCSRVYIYNLCKRYGIKPKTKSKARADAKLAGKNVLYSKVDENFFSQWTNEMSYVLGFIYADGNIHPHGALTMYQKEKEILDKIKVFMKSEHTIKRYKNNKNYLYHLMIGNKKIVKDLDRLGVKKNKSLIIEFPNIPDNFVNHFVRGYFDGDGSIYRKGGGWTFSLVSGSKRFIQQLKNKLEEYGVTEKVIYKFTNAEAFYFKYGGKLDIIKLYAFLYDTYSLEHELYLKRKYEIFKQAIEYYENKRGLGVK